MYKKFLVSWRPWAVGVGLLALFWAGASVLVQQGFVADRIQAVILEQAHKEGLDLQVERVRPSLTGNLRLEEVRFSGEIDGEKVEFEADAVNLRAWPWRLPQLASNPLEVLGDVRLERPLIRIQSLPGDMGLVQMGATPAGRAWAGEPLRLSFQGRVQIQQGKIILPELGMIEVDGVVRAQGSRVITQGLDLQVLGSPVLLDGWADLAREEMDIQAQVLDARVENFVALLEDPPAAVRGSVTGVVGAKGAWERPMVSMDLTAPEGLEILVGKQEIQLDAAMLKGKTDGATLWVDEGIAEKSGGWLALRGQVGEELQLALRGEDFLPLDQWLPELSGKGWLDGTLTGSPTHPKFAGEVALLDGGYRGYGLDRLQAEVSWEPNDLQIHRARLGQGMSLLEVAGRMDAGELDLEWIMTQGSLEDLLGLAHLELPVTGQVEGRGWVTGTVDNPKLEARIQGEELVAYGQPLEVAQVKLRVEDGVLHFDQAQAQMDEGLFTAKGEILAGGGLDLVLEGKEIPLDLVGVLPEEWGLIQGIADMTLALGGSLRDPQVRGEVGGRQVDLGGLYFDQARAQIRYEDGRLLFLPATLQSGRANYQVDGEIWSLGSIPELDLMVQVDSERLHTLLTLMGVDLQGFIDGDLSGNIALTGPIHSPHARMKADLVSGRWTGQPLQAALDLEMKDGQVQIHSLDLPGVGEGTGLQRLANLTQVLEAINPETLIPIPGIAGESTSNGLLDLVGQIPFGSGLFQGLFSGEWMNWVWEFFLGNLLG